MQKTVEFLKSCGYYFLATVDGDQPRNRPLGLVEVIDGKLFFGVGTHKEVYNQLVANPKVEVCGVNKSMETIRVSGKAVFDNKLEHKDKLVAEMPSVKATYADPNGLQLGTFYIDDIKSYITRMDNTKEVLI
ncbi:Pyridoxamine 5'-phosphate oxidase family protein [Entamoeba marina]